MSTLLAFATAEEAGGAHLPMPPWAYGLTALVVFALLLLLVWMFRHTAQTMMVGGHGDAHGTHGGQRHPHATAAGDAEATRPSAPSTHGNGRHH